MSDASVRQAVKDELDGEVFAHLAKMPEPHRRLLEPLVAVEVPDGWLRDALLAYLRHFVRVLDRGEPRASAEAELIDALSALAGTTRTGDDERDLEVAEAELAIGFRQRGYRFLGGRTPPHLGPYVWARTETQRLTGGIASNRPLMAGRSALPRRRPADQPRRTTASQAVHAAHRRARA